MIKYEKLLFTYSQNIQKNDNKVMQCWDKKFRLYLFINFGIGEVSWIILMDVS